MKTATAYHWDSETTVCYPEVEQPDGKTKRVRVTVSRLFVRGPEVEHRFVRVSRGGTEYFCESIRSRQQKFWWDKSGPGDWSKWKRATTHKTIVDVHRAIKSLLGEQVAWEAVESFL